MNQLLKVVVMAVVSGTCGCMSAEDRAELEVISSVTAVITCEHTSGYQPDVQVSEFYLGKLEGGRACVALFGGTPFTAAADDGFIYWVKDGIVYAVNDRAIECSPAIPVAPASVTPQAALEVAI